MSRFDQEVYKIIPLRIPSRLPAIQSTDPSIEELEKRRGGYSLFNESPKEHECLTLTEWVREIITRRERGHTLFVADDYFASMLGFVDDDENQVFYVSLVTLKETTKSEIQGLGLNSEILRSVHARRDFIEGPDPDFSYSSYPTIERGLNPALQEIWVAESEVDRPPALVPELAIHRPDR